MSRVDKAPPVALGGAWIEVNEFGKFASPEQRMRVVHEMKPVPPILRGAFILVRLRDGGHRASALH